MVNNYLFLGESFLELVFNYQIQLLVQAGKLFHILGVLNLRGDSRTLPNRPLATFTKNQFVGRIDY